MLQRALFGGKRRAAQPAPQLFFGQLHLGRGGDQLLLDLREGRVSGRHAALHQTLGQGGHILAQPAFGNRECRDVLAPLLRCGRATVTQPVERTGHDIALTRHEPVGGILLWPAAATATAATRLLRLLVVLRERTHVEEIHVAATFVTTAITRHRVIRDQVTGLQPQLFEEDGVRPARITRTARGAVLHRHALLLAPIHAIAQLQRGHTQIIAGPHRHRDFIGVAHLRVATRLLNAHDGRAVGNGVHHVLHRAGHHRAAQRLQVHPIEPAALDDEGSGYHAVTLRHERDGGAVVEVQLAALHRARNLGAQHHRRADNGRDIAAVVDMLGGQAAVGRESQIQREVGDRRQIADRERVRGRAHIGRLHVVLGHAREIEQPRAEPGRIRVAAHRQSRPFGPAVAAEHELCAIGGKPDQMRLHFQRAASRDGGVARQHLHQPHRDRRLRRLPRHKEQARAIAQRRGAQHEQQRRANRQPAQPLRGAHHAWPLQRGALLQRPDRSRSARDQSCGEGRGHPLRLGAMRLLHRRQQILTQRGRALLDIQREALIAGAAQQRDHQPTHDRRNNQGVSGHPRPKQHRRIPRIPTTEQANHQHGREYGEQRGHANPHERFQQHTLTPLPA